MQTHFGRIGVCVMFSIITLTPTLFWPTGSAMNVRLSENRVPAAIPQPDGTLSGLTKSISAFRSWYNDNFPFRDVAIQADAVLKLRLAGNQWTDRVLIGTGEWLFLRRTRDGIPVTLPVTEFTDTELQAWVELIEGREQRLSELGITYFLIIAPDKAAVYPEKRPNELLAFQPDIRQHQLLGRLSESGRVQFVDLRSALREARSAYPDLYYRTDTHWNAFGGWAASRAICRQLQLENPFETDSRLVSSRENSPYRGDLQKLLGAPDGLPESRVHFSPADGFSWQRIAADNHQEQIPEYARTFATELPEQNRPSAVIFRDSFTLELQPFLSECFRRAVYVWQYEMDFDLVRRERPDIVLDIFVERQLHGPPPALEMQP